MAEYTGDIGSKGRNEDDAVAGCSDFKVFFFLFLLSRALAVFSFSSPSCMGMGGGGGRS